MFFINFRHFERSEKSSNMILLDVPHFESVAHLGNKNLTPSPSPKRQRGGGKIVGTGRDLSFQKTRTGLDLSLHFCKKHLTFQQYFELKIKISNEGKMYLRTECFCCMPTTTILRGKIVWKEKLLDNFPKKRIK